MSYGQFLKRTDHAWYFIFEIIQICFIGEFDYVVFMVKNISILELFYQMDLRSYIQSCHKNDVRSMSGVYVREINRTKILEVNRNVLWWILPIGESTCIAAAPITSSCRVPLMHDSIWHSDRRQQSTVCWFPEHYLIRFRYDPSCCFLCWCACSLVALGKRENVERGSDLNRIKYHQEFLTLQLRI